MEYRRDFLQNIMFGSLGLAFVMKMPQFPQDQKDAASNLQFLAHLVKVIFRDHVDLYIEVLKLKKMHNLMQGDVPTVQEYLTMIDLAAEFSIAGGDPYSPTFWQDFAGYLQKQIEQQPENPDINKSMAILKFITIEEA